MRKLASVQKIIDIQPIEGADMIEVATVLGWKCVIAKKDNFQIGDNVVYFEVDSIVPEKELFEFLRQRKFRIKTIKLKGQISQGLVMPLSILPKGKYNAGDDVTDVLGVKKYDPEGDLENRLNSEKENLKQNRIQKYMYRFNWFRKLFPKKSYRFPEFIAKTDETRIQAIPQVLEQIKNVPVYITEKFDGQSVTFFLLKKKKFFIFDDFEFGVCSRNLQLKKDNSNWWNAALKYDVENILKDLFSKYNCVDFIAIQGEIVGVGIQENKYKFNDQKLFVFNFIVDGIKIALPQVVEVLSAYNIETVEILEEDVYLDASLDELVEYSNGESVLYPTLREGIVVRDYNGYVSFKVISPKFLLKNDL